VTHALRVKVDVSSKEVEIVLEEIRFRSAILFSAQAVRAFLGIRPVNFFLVAKQAKSKEDHFTTQSPSLQAQLQASFTIFYSNLSYHY
jgi:hypothetical protein